MADITIQLKKVEKHPLTSFIAYCLLPIAYCLIASLPHCLIAYCLIAYCLIASLPIASLPHCLIASLPH